ncbi:helix-turn-helix transcriptional regulator [Pseudomaricurvus alkylphenolicus]|uniref:helix-turn-helix domain-containing protein n=1 Tax=Pseudomaricurvus alkylphenolicus TaxID=1306991 RepID=UPI00142235B9|nr:AraC family transcriptional regulator [Pseudomaricurvus alkylphenolicus]NIB42412.1 helix-turn-helix transcriptional regulator [Pseudomaricurvus alkylphenolicus]
MMLTQPLRNTDIIEATGGWIPEETVLLNGELSCGGKLLRICPELDKPHNYVEAFQLSDGLYCSVTNLSEDADTEVTVDGTGVLGLAVQLQGEFYEPGSGVRLTSARQPVQTMAYVPAGTQITVGSQLGKGLKSVSISAQADYLSRALGLSSDELPVQLREFFTGSLDQFELKQVNVPMAAIASASKLLNHPETGGMRYRNLTLFANELLLHFLQALSEAPPQVTREQRQLAKVREIIEASPGQQHTLDTLADAVGLSRTRLTSGFKRQYGATVMEWLRETRFREAERLLNTTALPLAEIAFETGFSSPSNFTSAFKKRFGVSPRDKRRLLIAAAAG